MKVESTAGLHTRLEPAVPSRQEPAAVPTALADRVSISQTARDLYSSGAAQPQSQSQPGPVAAETGETGGAATSATFDTNKGRVALDIESYFVPPTGRGANLDTLPLLAPSPQNIKALSNFISEQMPGFLADHGIPTPPASISYDSRGQIQLPANYPHAAEFKQALQDSPVMDRALRTTSALTSAMVGMQRSMPFQEEYAAATSQAEIDAVVAKYQHLFSNQRQYDSIDLNFTAEGALSITQNGRPLP